VARRVHRRLGWRVRRCGRGARDRSRWRPGRHGAGHRSARDRRNGADRRGGASHRSGPTGAGRRSQAPPTADGAGHPGESWPSRRAPRTVGHGGSAAARWRRPAPAHRAPERRGRASRGQADHGQADRGQSGRERGDRHRARSCRAHRHRARRGCAAAAARSPRPAERGAPRGRRRDRRCGRYRGRRRGRVARTARIGTSGLNPTASSPACASRRRQPRTAHRPAPCSSGPPAEPVGPWWRVACPRTTLPSTARRTDGPIRCSASRHRHHACHATVVTSLSMTTAPARTTVPWTRSPYRTARPPGRARPRARLACATGRGRCPCHGWRRTGGPAGANRTRQMKICQILSGRIPFPGNRLAPRPPAGQPPADRGRRKRGRGSPAPRSPPRRQPPRNRRTDSRPRLPGASGVIHCVHGYR